MEERVNVKISTNGATAPPSGLVEDSRESQHERGAQVSVFFSLKSDWRKKKKELSQCSLAFVTTSANIKGLWCQKLPPSLFMFLF